MAAITTTTTTSPISLYEDMKIVQLVDEKVPEIAINFKTGEYVFTKGVMLKAAKVGLKNILIPVAGGLIVGGVIGHLVALSAVGGIILGCKEPVAVGMGAGALGGAAVGGAYVVLKGVIKIREINREITQININSNRIIDRIFRTMVRDEVEQSVQFYCPISNRLMHIPVSTGCNAQRDKDGGIMIDSDGNVMRITDETHIFDYNALRNHLKISTMCPHAGCEEEIKPSEFFFEQETRQRINVVINRALTWMVLHNEGEYRDYDETEPSFLENVDEICDRIEEGNTTRDDLSLLSYLLRKNVDKYNDQVMEFYFDLVEDLRNKKDVKSIEQARLSGIIMKLLNSYIIKLPELNDVNK